MYGCVHHNSMWRLATYFFGHEFAPGSPHSPQEWIEFREFWLSLSDDERRYYRTVDLKTGRPCVEQVCAEAYSRFF
jgi:hypothetical protein